MPNVFGTYEAAEDFLTIGLTSVTDSGLQLEPEYAAIPAKIGIDALPYTVYRFFSSSHKPSSVILKRFTPQWSNNFPYLASVLSVFLSDSIGYTLRVTNSAVTKEDISQPAILAVIRSTLEQQ